MVTIKEIQSKIKELERKINCVKNHPESKPINCCYQADTLEYKSYKEITEDKIKELEDNINILSDGELANSLKKGLEQIRKGECLVFDENKNLIPIMDRLKQLENQLIQYKSETIRKVEEMIDNIEKYLEQQDAKDMWFGLFLPLLNQQLKRL